MLTGRFDELADLYIFVQWIFYALAVVCVFGWCRRQPNFERPYRAFGYPVLPIPFIASAAAFTMSHFIENPGRSAAGLLVISSGLIFCRKRQKA